MRVAASWFAMFCGWAVSWIAVMLWTASASHGNGVGDFDFLLWWPLAFCVIGWALVGLPFVAWAGRHPRLLDFPASALAGAALSLSAYWLVIGWSLHGALPLLPLFAAGVGLVALPVHAAIVRASDAWPPAKRRRAIAWLAVSPFIAFAGAWFVAWPLIERAAPAAVYGVASTESQTRMQVRALRQVRVGDRLVDLRARFPYVFDRETTANTGNAGDVRYAIRFRDGRVSEAVVSRR